MKIKVEADFNNENTLYTHFITDLTGKFSLFVVCVAFPISLSTKDIFYINSEYIKWDIMGLYQLLFVIALKRI
jgi:hypothetical protein